MSALDSNPKYDAENPSPWEGMTPAEQREYNQRHGKRPVTPGRPSRPAPGTAEAIAAEIAARPPAPPVVMTVSTEKPSRLVQQAAAKAAAKAARKRR